MARVKRIPHINKLGEDIKSYNHDYSFWFSDDITKWTSKKKESRKQYKEKQHGTI